MEYHAICDGCPRRADDRGCPYGVVPTMYIRRDECAFNPKIVATKKEKVRVGQQKQKRRR